MGGLIAKIRKWLRIEKKPESRLRARAQIGDVNLPMASSESELLAQQVSSLNQKLADLERRIVDAEKVNARLEQAALTTARALAVISGHWDAVYEAMRREETRDPNENLGGSG